MKKMIRKISALILAFVMTAGVIPTSVMADTEVVNAQETESNVIPSLEVGNEYTITITEDGAKEVWYQFTPAESGYYTAYANGEFDSYCELYDSNKEYLTYNDDGFGGRDFSLQYEMTAGTTYYYKFRMFSETVYGSYKVNLVKNIAATSIKLNRNSCTAYVGTYLYLSAEFLPEFGVGGNISWTSSDESVATVDEYGNVELLSAGETVITATSDSGLSDSCKVTVKPAVDAALNTTYNISTDGENNTGVLYKFVPEESRYYRFYTFNGECDTYGRLYDENYNELTYDDDNGDGNHFIIDYELQAGNTYYIYVTPCDINDVISCDFAIKEINPTKIKDIYFTVDNVNQENFGFSVTEANEVTLWLEFSMGDDIEISSVRFTDKRIDKDFNEYTLNTEMEYDAEKNLYYTKIPAHYFIDGCDFSVNNVMVYDKKDDCRVYNSVNGTPIDTVFYYMGANVITKEYKGYLNALDNTSEVFVTTPRVTSLAEMGIEMPEVPVIEGAEFLGWELIISGNSCDLIKSVDQKFSLGDSFINTEPAFTLEAKYDKNIIKGNFRYTDKDGNDAERIVYGAIDKNQEITYAQWLESVIAGNQLSDIEHIAEMKFDGWDIEYDYEEYTIDSGFTEIYVDAKYVFDGIILGGVHIKDGDYLNNNGEVSKTEPKGGYGFYSDGKLTLHNYSYKGFGSDSMNKNYALYMASDLELVLEGNNKLHCLRGDVIHNDLGNLTISGDGYLDIKTYKSSDGIDLVDGNLTIKSGVLTVESGDHGCEIDGAITIDGGIIKIKAGDEGMDFDDDFVINDGIVDIDSEDKGLDSSDNIYVKGGFIKVKTEDNEGLEAGYNIIVDGGNIVIDANGIGLYAFEDVEINGGYIQIKSGDYAVMAEYGITFGDNMDKYEIIQLDEYMVSIGVNGEPVKEAVIKSKDATELSFIDDSWLSLSEERIVYTGEKIKPDITITDGKKVLAEGTDYTVSCYTDEIKEVGEYLLIITGKGSYSGTILKKVTVYEDVIYIGNTVLESGNYLAIGSEEVSDEKPESVGYAYYKNGVLELNNYSYEGNGYLYDVQGYNSIIYADFGVALKLVGKNSLINTDSMGEGINVNGLLKINGYGSINIDGVFGIGNFDGNIVVDSGNISISAEDDAIWGYEDIIVNGGKLDIAGEYGIWCDFGNVYINGGIINIDAVYGLYAYSTVYFNDGIANIKGSEWAVSTANGNIEFAEGIGIIKPENGKTGVLEEYTYVLDSEDNIATDITVMGDYAPVVYGAEDGKTYYRPVTINVYDNNPVSITVNGEPVEDMSAPIVLDNTVPETYVIEVTDASDNVVDVTVTVKPVTDISETIFNINESNVVPEDEEILEEVKAELEKALEEYGSTLTDEEIKMIEYEIRRVDNILEVLDGKYATVYFDNSKTNWECVFAYYEDKNGEINVGGQVLSDENGIYTIKVPVDSRIQFCNYLPGQPPEEAPDEGFLHTDFMVVEDGKTYKYEVVITAKALGDVNADTIINAQDALLVLKHAARLVTLTDDEALVADVKTDDIINAEDALEILKYAAKLIDSL